MISFIFVFILGGIFCGLLVLYLSQRKLIYFPLKSPPQLNALSQHYKVVFTKTRDNLKLLHWMSFSHSKQNPWIVVFHGNAGHIESRGYKYKFFLDAGYPLFLVEYRGYGKNPGSPSEFSLTDDSLKAVEWLMKNETLDPSEIVLYGESLGSCVAVAVAHLLAQKNKFFQKIILEGAPSSILEVGKRHHFPYLPIQYLLKDTWNSKERIQNIRSSFLFIHGKKDSVVPFEFGKELYKVTPFPKKHLWLENKEHNNKLEDFETRQQLLNFLNSS